ncbi:hypothetical protein B4071_1928 [Bacillus subtilis]|nr:hypothetical protein B4071_1928 [Bacillus subtilis]MCB4339235.1 hypothetical protein [Bacillus subtilis]
MKRVLFSVIVFTAVGFTFCQSKAHALTFTVLPITQKTEQWSVKVSEAKNVKEFARPQKGEYQVYSLEVKNIGEKAATVDVQLYCNCIEMILIQSQDFHFLDASMKIVTKQKKILKC